MKLVAAEFITLDGVVEGPNEWMGDFFDDRLGERLIAEATERDVIVLGRRTYEEMAEAWPSQGDSHPMAASMNNTPKLVVSSTLDNVDAWQNSTLVTGDAVTALQELKQRPGRNAMIIGSATLVRLLLGRGVIDELALLVFPVVAGHGERLFDVQWICPRSAGKGGSVAPPSLDLDAWGADQPLRLPLLDRVVRLGLASGPRPGRRHARPGTDSSATFVLTRG